MADPLILAAAIGALPASLAAWAAIRVNTKVSTNGSSKHIGLLVEAVYDDLKKHCNDPAAHHRDNHTHNGG